jgi:hypothetical protein
MSDENDLMLAWLNDQTFKQAEDYLRRGRGLADVPTAELKERWIVTFKAWAANWRNEPLRDLRAALEAELSLRKEEPPHDSVKPEMEALVNASRKATEQLERDPKRMDEVQRGLQEELDIFKQSFSGKKN